MDDGKCSEAGKMKKGYYWNNDAWPLFQRIVVHNYYDWFAIKGHGTKGRSGIEPNRKLLP